MALICHCKHPNSESASECAGCGQSLTGAELDGMVGRTVFGTYRLEQVLGRGGMSIVYRGKHVVTEQDVAVKVLPPELATHREVKARFIEEARTLARLEHPNIVQLYNFLEEDGHLYLVMQYADGESFEDIINNEGRVSVGDAVTVGVEVLKALEYAHERGVVHRDIKPSNIVIRGDSAVKVMDFGIAKIVGSSKLTQTGQTMGTVRYMSPEQVRGKQVDHRSDLYSLGVTIYAAACGRTPFDGDNHFDIMRMHLTEPPPRPSELVSMPIPLEEALLKVLQKRPESRYQTARELRRALQAVPLGNARRKITASVPMAPLDDTTGRLEAARADRRPGHRRVNVAPVVVAALLLLAAIVAVVWTLVDDSRRPAVAVGAGHEGHGEGGDPSPRRMDWPEPHRVAGGLSWRVDRRYEDVQLRVLSVDERDPAALRAVYARARDSYRRFLGDEGVKVDFAIGPLNLAIVPQSLLNSRSHWPTAKPDVDYPTRYEPLQATLYVQNGPRMMSSDLPYGLALHFCARGPLTNDRCYELAEGFERHLAGQPASSPVE